MERNNALHIDFTAIIFRLYYLCFTLRAPDPTTQNNWYYSCIRNFWPEIISRCVAFRYHELCSWKSAYRSHGTCHPGKLRYTYFIWLDHPSPVILKPVCWIVDMSHLDLIQGLCGRRGRQGLRDSRVREVQAR